MNIEIITVPGQVFCATDSSLPRWRFIAAAINRTNRVWLIEKVRIRVKGGGRVHTRTLSGDSLKRLILQGDLSVKPKGVVVVEIADDGEMKSPISVSLRMFFSGRDGSNTSVVGEVALPRYKTIWLDFPLAGLWTSANGRKDHHCLGSQFGFDFVTPEDMEIHLKPEQKKITLDAFSSLGKPLYSPADGVVVSCSNGERDYRRPLKQTIGNKPVSLRKLVGNHVLIETADRQFILLAHMLKQSLKVRVGDIVSVRDYLGDVGNSGNTTGPHLHIEILQARPDFSQPAKNAALPTGLPFGFKNVTRHRKELVSVMHRCVPRKLDQLENNRRQLTTGST